MKRFAIIENGAVKGITKSETALEPNWIESDTASKGDLYDGTTFSAPPPPPPPTPAELEAEVQLLTDQILDGEEKLIALALATVDLVMAENAGAIDGLTKTQVRQEFRTRVETILRERRGI